MTKSFEETDAEIRDLEDEIILLRDSSPSDDKARDKLKVLLRRAIVDLHPSFYKDNADIERHIRIGICLSNHYARLNDLIPENSLESTSLAERFNEVNDELRELRKRSRGRMRENHGNESSQPPRVMVPSDETKKKRKRVVAPTSGVENEKFSNGLFPLVVPDDRRNTLSLSQSHVGETPLVKNTSQLQSLMNARETSESLESTNGISFPYVQEEVKILFLRKCYSEVCEILISRLSTGSKNNAISGTPGIGKSRFFIYLLFRLLKNRRSGRKAAWSPRRIIYHHAHVFRLFDLENCTVSDLVRPGVLLEFDDTLYILDGCFSEEVAASCYVLFISSPRSESFRHFITKKSPEVLYLPVWTWDEIEMCRRICFGTLSEQCVRERFLMIGGNARFVFVPVKASNVNGLVDSAIGDVDILTAMEYVGNVTEKYRSTHMLFHTIVDENYEQKFLDFASPYVGLRLMEKYFVQLMSHIARFLHGDPSHVVGHFFELYGNLVLSRGISLKCRSLLTGEESEMTFQSFGGKRSALEKNNLPAAPLNAYYVPNEPNFPAIDAMSSQGMFQFTVTKNHPIRGVQMLRKLCRLYSNPKLFFVVPSAIYEEFNKQEFEATKKGVKVAEIRGLQQFVIKLPITQDLDEQYIRSQLKDIIHRDTVIGS